MLLLFMNHHKNLEKIMLSFEADPNEEIADGLRVVLGGERVGWIFTDLWSL
jgi:hypothetical protein